MGATKNSARFGTKLTLTLASFFLTVSALFSQPQEVRTEFLPEITTLSGRIVIPDSVPRQTVLNFTLKDYNDDVERASMAQARGDTVLVQFYRYTAQKGDTVIGLSARLSVPQETLATANGLDSTDSDIVGRELILPAAAGLFVAQSPSSTLEMLVAQENEAYLHQQGDSVPVYRIGGRTLYFLQGARLSSTARAFFLDTSLRLPLSDYVLTSEFGGRVSPISGKWLQHNGVDLAAPTGTPVYACKRGTVIRADYGDAVYGNNIIIQHANGMTSRYAHLSEISVKKEEHVSTGTVIGKVGTTGLSTGPHLHFEVWQNGKATNPLRSR